VLNLLQWLEDVKKSKIKKPMPVLSFPGIQITGTTVDKLVRSGELQAETITAVARRFDTLAAVSLMDLSVEAEAFGSPIAYSAEEVPTVTGKIADTEEEVLAIRVPKVGEGRTGECLKAVRLAKKSITDRPLFGGTIGPFSLSGRLLDMTEIMVKTMIEPELVELTVAKAASFILDYIKAIKAEGANGVIMAEPAAGLLSPELNARFSVPFIRKIIEEVQDENFLVIYHNCGNTIPLIQDILTIGTKIVHFGNAIEMDKMLPLVPGDILVAGNVDPSSQFRNGTPEGVRQRTLEVLGKCGGYPNYILSSGCDIPPMSPLDNIDAFFQAHKEYYGY
jgi:uroporphyrinogen decarboxylase